MECDERILLSQFKSGDRRAFDRLFKLYAPRLGSFCLRLINPSDAEEIVQYTFLKLWENREKFDIEQNFNTYMVAIAKNLIYDLFRQQLLKDRYCQKLQEALREQMSVDNKLYADNLHEVMISSINKLPDQQREVMSLKIKEFNNEEIAELLGISKRTVEAHLNKAYKKLRIDLKETRYCLFLSLLF